MKRFFSSLFIFVIFIVSIFYIKSLFIPIIVIMYCFMIFEWYKMTGFSYFLAIGFITISASILGLNYIFSVDPTGSIIFTYFCIIWFVDIFAMFVGTIFPNTLKLSPRISPKKTVIGFIFGVMSSGTVVYILDCILYLKLSYLDLYSKLSISIFSIFLAACAQISDLFVSFFKRKFDIKDSGNYIPGHGGFLDRFDSTILTSPILCICLYFFYY